MMFTHRWQQWTEHVLTRPVPHTLVSWRFLLPGQSRAVDLHRQVFLGAWPRRSRWQWALIALYSSISWLTFFSWKQIYFCMKNSSRELTDEFNIPVRKQLIDLLVLALLHGVPPWYYYYYELFQRPRKQWLEYIYPHELPHWHQVLSAGVSRKTLHLMSDKRAFAEHMAEQGMASVQTCDFLARGCQIEADRIFSGRSLFLKPNAGSRGEGCLILSFDEQTGRYSLCGDDIAEKDEGDILAAINRRVQQRDYLMQPLLQNHAVIQDLCGASKLVVLRLVTGMVKDEPVALFAILNIPCSEEMNAFWCLDVDVASGRLLNRENVEPDEFQRLMHRMSGEMAPFWQQSVEICQQAHRQFSDLPCVGWDVVMTSSGVVLLEGNFNWEVAEHQHQGPALDTALIDVYQSSQRFMHHAD